MPPARPDETRVPRTVADRTTVGQRIKGRYRIVGEVGVGAFGTVCRAEDEATGHEVAIRLFPSSLVGALPPAGPKGPKGEAIVAASTAHPALVGVLEVGETESGCHFAAMELVQGRRLSEIIAEGPLDVRSALRVAIELGSALETLHNSGLIHGALRPCNVMVAEDWSVKLMDVELCGWRAESATRGVAGVRPHHEYLSPEEIRQWAGTEETDVYAFGTLLYEMLSGAPPFRGKVPEELLKKQLSATPVPLRRRRWSVPASVDAIVAQALSKRPERRPPMQTILNCLWQEANAPATGWRRRALIIAGIAFAASIPVLVGWGLLAPHSPTPAPPPLSAPATVQSPASNLPGVAAPGPNTPAPTGAAPAGAGPAGTAPAGVASAPAVGRSTSPSTSVSRTPKAASQKQPSVPPTPADSPREQPPASNSSGDPDPGQVVDWLLERAAARRK